VKPVTMQIAMRRVSSTASQSGRVELTGYPAG
jgi:hypothetical protein